MRVVPFVWALEPFNSLCPFLLPFIFRTFDHFYYLIAQLLR